MSAADEQAIKIILVGPSNVGKSALLKRYCEDDFDPNDATSTIGIDYRVKRLSVHGKPYRITLLDTAGQERFRTLSNSYYRGTHGVVFVYDLTDRATFVQMDDWFAEAEANTAGAGGSNGVPYQYCLVASKSDRADTSRAVSAEEGRALACSYSYSDCSPDEPEPLFFESSARTGENVRALFVALVDRIVTAGLRPPITTAGTVDLKATSANSRRSYIPGCYC